MRTKIHWIKKHTSRTLLMASIVGLSACGGGGSEDVTETLLPEPANLEEAYEILSTYSEIEQALSDFRALNIANASAGPLIRNGDNDGLIDIDVVLSSTASNATSPCSGDADPTVRDAMICTIEEGGRGNRTPSSIGKSNKGKELLAVRIGNPTGPRVMVITQQHGNEPASTEAAINFILNKASTSAAAQELDMLFVVRANPDGGEPTTDCATSLPIGMPFTGDCAFTRTNLDPSAGGGFTSNTESGFFGVVGQGYNMNRYHFANLDGAIRPVEVQALVGATIAFSPDYVLDLHGDVNKTDCVLDLSSLVPNAVLGVLPSVECLQADESGEFDRSFSIFANAPTSSEQAIETRALGSSILNEVAINTPGTVGRFSQLQSGAGTVSDSTTSSYRAALGAVSAGWESANFGLAFRPDVFALIDGVPTIGQNTHFINPAFLRAQISLNQVALEKALDTITEFQTNPPTDDNGFCDFPLATGLKGSAPTALFGSGGSDETAIIPIQLGLGIPVSVSGNCPLDPA